MKCEFVDYGLSVWQRDVVESMVPKGDAADLADLFIVLSESDQLAGLEAQERFYEIGSPNGLERSRVASTSGWRPGDPSR